MNFKIGIVGWNTGDNSFGITKPYGEYFSMFGEIIVLGPMKGTLDLDLLVLPGGQDISSHIYGKRPSFYNSNPDLMKEFFMQNNLQQYIEKGTPIFGICLGMQQLNVHFGGKLLQNIPHPVSTKSRGEEVHSLIFDPRYQHLRSDHKKKYEVNSLHHQAVDDEYVPECLEVVAKANDDIIEIIKHRELPIWGVQYHPEELYDSASMRIVQNLLEYEPAEAI